MNHLPTFRSLPYPQVLAYANRVFTRLEESDSQLIRLEVFSDSHYRAIFRSTYFDFKDGRTVPSKSQWGSLKKKMKRHHKKVFVFRQRGQVDCEEDEKATCYYIDFGFFMD